MVEEIRERVQGNSGKVMDNVPKGTNAARKRIKEQLQELRKRQELNEFQEQTASVMTNKSYKGPTLNYCYNPIVAKNEHNPIQEHYDSIFSKKYTGNAPMNENSFRRVQYETQSLVIPHQDNDSDNSEEMQIIKALNQNDNEVPYDDSLFNIIDEIEANDLKQEYKPILKNTERLRIRRSYN